MSEGSKMWLGIGAVVVIAVVLFLAFGVGEASDLPACEAPYETPCLTDAGLVLVPDRTGQLVALSRDVWEAERADAQYDLVPPFAGPGPNAP